MGVLPNEASYTRIDIDAKAKAEEADIVESKVTVRVAAKISREFLSQDRSSKLLAGLF